MDAHEAMRVAELGEAMYMRQFFDRADEHSHQELGLATARIGGGVVAVMADDPTPGFWNRTIGLGVTEPLTSSVVADVLAFVVENRGRLTMFQVAPGADPAGWETVLGEAGCVPMSSWVKFVGEPRATPDIPTGLHLEVLGPEHGEAYARVMCTGFGMPLDSPLPRWFRQFPSWDGGFTTYGVFDGDEMVAGACLVVDGEIGSLCGAATLESYRGRGVQGALMARRIGDAAAAGCRWVVTETGAETPDNPHNSSLRNMRRAGLTELYGRRNHVWFAPET